MLEVNELGFTPGRDSLLLTSPEPSQEPSRVQDALLLELVQECGLRIEEAIALRREDIATLQGFLYVRAVKGRRGRLAPLPSKVSFLVEGMEPFLNRKNPYLFQSGEAHLSEEAALRILRGAGVEGKDFFGELLDGQKIASVSLEKTLSPKRRARSVAVPAYYRKKSAYPSGRGPWKGPFWRGSL